MLFVALIVAAWTFSTTRRLQVGRGVLTPPFALRPAALCMRLSFSTRSYIRYCTIPPRCACSTCAALRMVTAAWRGTSAPLCAGRVGRWSKSARRIVFLCLWTRLARLPFGKTTRGVVGDVSARHGADQRSRRDPTGGQQLTDTDTEQRGTSGSADYHRQPTPRTR